MLTAPVGFSEDTLAAALHREWKIEVATMAYRAVGFGSHHWEVLELYRVRWDLADLAVDLDRFARPHTGNADDETSFRILRDVISRNIGEIP